MSRSPFRSVIFLAIALSRGALFAAALPKSDEAALAPRAVSFLEDQCYDCHDADTKKGGLDLTALKFDLREPKTFEAWVKVHDLVREGEMPPKKKKRPDPAAQDAFLHALGEPMLAEEKARVQTEGRSTWRRLNRFEYENTLRDLLGAPWLQIKEMLPEDGESHRFNKLGDALDVSHVQMARYLGAADYALREVLARQVEQPMSKTVRYYAREQRGLIGKMKFSAFNKSPERATFPLLGNEAQVDVLTEKAPVSVGAKDPEMREREAFGVVASSYEPIEPKFDAFEAKVAGRYKLRLCAHSFWADPESEEKWWKPSREKASAGRRDEPVVLYSEKKPRQLRRLGAVDVQPESSVQELDALLLPGETIRVDAARLFRSRPGKPYHNPLAERDGQPGVAFQWLEVEGPIFDHWPSAGQRLLFGDLPVTKTANGEIAITPRDAAADADRLLRGFVARACRRPLGEVELQRYLGVIQAALNSGSAFTDAMIAGYSAVLCSPAFVCLEEKPGRLDDDALAARLSYFLWNSEPDAELRTLAAQGSLHESGVLRAQTDRLLADAKSRRFVNAFLDYWLDLRKANATSPDAALYPDYYLDDLLVDSAVEETQLFFAELLRDDLPARNVVASDFAILNERLAKHYGLPPVKGVTLRRVALPPESPRGGLMTQASVLKVTANGTTTSPVLRGAWIMERVLGLPPPPPPPTISVVEPDTRGATTIREQLNKHRTSETCAACHTKMDPAGFALENFDVLGGWRDRYRALGDGKREVGYGKNGQPFDFHLALPVDASGDLPGGGKFADVRELKRLLLADETQLARNLARQLVTYATGAAVRFGDRPEIEQLLVRASTSQYGVWTLIRELVQSDLFLSK